MTLKKDVKTIKKLLSENKVNKIRELVNEFLPSYNVKILVNLDIIERNQFIKILYHE